MIERKTKTVQDVITAVNRQFGDESGTQITSSDVIRWINDGQREIVLKNTEVNQAMVQINVSAGVTAYPVLANVPDMMVIHSLHYNGQILRPMTFVQAQEQIIQSDDTQVSDTPTFWYEYAGVINLWPKPSVSKDLGITIFYSSAPVTIADDSGPLSVPDSYFKALVDYCTAQAHELDQDFAAANVKAQQFETSIQVQANRTRSEDNQYPTITLLPEDDIY